MTNSLLELKIYKDIVDHMSAWVWICDAKLKTRYVNESFLKMLGYNSTQFKKIRPEHLWSEESLLHIKQYISGNQEMHNHKTNSKITTRMGNHIPVSVRWSTTPEDEVIAIIKDLREINTLKEAEEKLKKSNKDKDEFISIVGHELRTPLTSIRGYLSMALDGDFWEINETLKKALTHSYNSSVRMIQLVGDILTVGKMESGNMEYYMENVAIGPILHSVAQDVAFEMKNKQIDFQLILPQQLETTQIYIDENKLKQVFLNLITNAMKFTQAHGSITLKASKVKNCIRFEVIDTGEWIPKDKIQSLFTKFSQVESHLQRQNTSWLGIGLAIVKNFLDEFLSEVKVKSEIGKGSTFYFDLKIVK